jgi:hypothetical protein
MFGCHSFIQRACETSLYNFYCNIYMIVIFLQCIWRAACASSSLWSGVIEAVFWCSLRAKLLPEIDLGNAVEICFVLQLSFSFKL